MTSFGNDMMISKGKFVAHFICVLRLFIVVMVITSESEYSIVAIIQVMSGTLDISVELSDLM